MSLCLRNIFTNKSSLISIQAIDLSFSVLCCITILATKGHKDLNNTLILHYKQVGDF